MVVRPMYARADSESFVWNLARQVAGRVVADDDDGTLAEATGELAVDALAPPRRPPGRT